MIPDFANFTLLNGRVDPLFWQQQWNRANALPAGAPPLRPGTLGSRRPMDRIGEAFGSFTNPRNLILTEAAINGMKGRLFGFVAPFAPNTFRTDIQNALRADNADAARDLRTVMTRIQEVSHEVV